jgi:hypothetical protein
MQQVDGMKVIVLTRGDLTGTLESFLKPNNPRSDAGLNSQESAEAIVPRLGKKTTGRAERRDVFNF